MCLLSLMYQRQYRWPWARGESLNPLTSYSYSKTTLPDQTIPPPSPHTQSDLKTIFEFLNDPANADYRHDYELALTNNLDPTTSKLFPRRRPLTTWSAISDWINQYMNHHPPTEDQQPHELTYDDSSSRGFRNSKDLGLRRLRPEDLPPAWQRTFNAWPKQVDTIWAMNMTLWVHLCPQSNLLAKNLPQRLFYSMQYFTDVCRSLTNYLKSTGSQDALPWFWWVESQNLVGFRTYPDPAINLQTLINDFTSDVSSEFNANEVYYMMHTPAKSGLKHDIIPFTEFLRRPDLWQTDGRTRLGKLSFQHDGKQISFRARKKDIPFFMTPDDLVKTIEEAILKPPKQTNTLLIKEEAGKIRLAIGSDDVNYFIMAWMYYAVSGFAHGTNITLGESVPEEIERNLTWMQALASCYSMPYDFANYERQVTFYVIAAAFDRIIQQLGPSFQPTPFEVRCLVWCRKAIFNVNVIAAFDPKHPQSFWPPGGLSSGLFLTSLIGNLGNLAFSSRAAAAASIHNPSVRGDDGSWFGTFRTNVIAYIFMTALGYKAGKGKFSVLQSETEFLRQMYTPRGIYGYPSRALIALTQRKPWSDGPWMVTDTFSDVSDALYTMERRLASHAALERLHSHWASRYSTLLSVPKAVLTAPKSLGGLGGHFYPDITHRYTVSSPFVPSTPYVLPHNKLATWYDPRDLRGQAFVETKTQNILRQAPDPENRKRTRHDFNDWLKTVRFQATPRDRVALQDSRPFLRFYSKHTSLRDIFDNHYSIGKTYKFYANPPLALDLQYAATLGTELTPQSQAALRQGKALGLSRGDIKSLAEGSIPHSYFPINIPTNYRLLFLEYILSLILKVQNYRPQSSVSIQNAVDSLLHFYSQNNHHLRQFRNLFHF